MHVVPSHCLRRIYIPHCVHHYFWPKFLQDQTGYLLKFIFISLTSCDAFQSFLLFIYYYYYYLQCGTSISSSPKNFAFTRPAHPKLEVTHFYIISHECAKAHKGFIFALTLEWFYTTQHGLT